MADEKELVNLIINANALPPEKKNYLLGYAQAIADLEKKEQK